MKSPITILVVEDRVNHIADCKAMLDAELPRLPIKINVLWASDLEEANRLFPEADAIMTDVFFPATLGSSDEEPCGQKVVKRCLMESKPVVWVTSTYHHGHKTDSINNWGRDRGLEMFDCQDAGYDGEGSHKPWKEALYGLCYLVIALEEGEAAFVEGKLVGDNSRAVDIYYFLDNQDLEWFPILRKMEVMGFHRN